MRYDLIGTVTTESGMPTLTISLVINGPPVIAIQLEHAGNQRTKTMRTATVVTQEGKGCSTGHRMGHRSLRESRGCGCHPGGCRSDMVGRSVEKVL